MAPPALTPIPRAERTTRIVVVLDGVAHEVRTSAAPLVAGRPLAAYVPGWRGTCPACLAGDVAGDVICRVAVDPTAGRPTILIEDLAVAFTPAAATAAALEARRTRRPLTAAYLRQSLYACGHRDLV
ncbi:hypothetical protein OOJ91_34205 [Micromonospora lupini]|uniref:hypothetical protein n=1 Tax=Micromonospora lupini TaxID=285679 RepID=UPI00224FFD3E|nr:hypothetical protein [Micromonospora lupini]MCX5070903.1 hypothetical protein [Micromonospora lupini]